MSQQFSFVKKVLSDPENKWYQYAMDVLHNTNPNCLDRFPADFIINGALLALPRQHKAEKENNCNIPWYILFGPTSTCNMRCTGCRAAEYGYQQNLTYETMDKIVTPGVRN